VGENWGWAIARGLLAIIFGLIALFHARHHLVALIRSSALRIRRRHRALWRAVARAPRATMGDVCCWKAILGSQSRCWVIWPLRHEPRVPVRPRHLAVLGGILEIGSRSVCGESSRRMVLALAGLLSIASA